MSQLQDLTRCLLAAGVAKQPEDKGMHLLYVNPERSTLTRKHWTGDSFGEQELIATSVRPNSPASYLITPTYKRVICISSSSTLRAIHYDDDEEDWVDDESVAHHEVHPEGSLAALLGVDGRMCVFIQDPSKHLIFLDEAWNPTVLPADPVEGSPLAKSIVGGKVHVSYISATDKCVHHVVQQQDGSWSDTIFTDYAFEKSPIKLLMMPNQSGALDAYVLTEENALLQITAEGKKTVLGKVDESGKLVPETTEEAGFFFFFFMWY